jgi:hypothetical protein
VHSFAMAYWEIQIARASFSGRMKRARQKWFSRGRYTFALLPVGAREEEILADRIVLNEARSTLVLWKRD